MTVQVQGRIRELGIRVALGARPEQIRTMVLSRGIRLSALGVALGFLASTQLTRLIESRLWGVRPMEPLVFGLAAVTLSTTALLACWGPAVRATRVDPVETLAEG